MTWDLRVFLDRLRHDHELVEISTEVDPQYQMASLMQQLDDRTGPAVLFSNVKGYSTNVAANLLGTMKRVAIALECQPEEIRDRIGSIIDESILPKIVSTGPVKEKIIKAPEKINLQQALPILTHAKRDGGPYITAGIVIAKDPDTGRRNLSYNRQHIKSGNRTAFPIDTWRHLREFQTKAEQLQEPLEVSISLGLDPAIEIAAAIKTPKDELELAGALRNQPIELVPGETVGVEAVAHAEVVIEGRIRLDETESEAPFAEFTGHYGLERQSNILDVTCIMMRQDAIYRDLLGGGSEHRLLGNVIPREPSLFTMVKRIAPGTTNVHLTPYTGGFIAIIQMAKQNEGEPQNAIMATYTSHVNIKYVIVVDPDVDIYNSKDVLWAIAMRTQGQRDFLFIPGALGHEDDPSTEPDGTTTKMGIDATVPLGTLGVRYQRIDFVNKQEWNLDRYLS